jgi:hypothetical protein
MIKNNDKKLKCIFLFYLKKFQYLFQTSIYFYIILKILVI